MFCSHSQSTISRDALALQSLAVHDLVRRDARWGEFLGSAEKEGTGKSPLQIGGVTVSTGIDKDELRVVAPMAT
jgi:hypothetical protein